MVAVHLTAPGPLPVVRDYRADELETTEVPDVRTLNAFGTGQLESIKYTGGHRSCHACFPDDYWHSVRPFQLRIMWTPIFLSWCH